MHLCNKFNRNRITHNWNMEIKWFLKWRPSAILNFRKLQFWSRVLYWHVILYFQSKFHINRLIWHRDIAKKTIFSMASVRHFEFAKFRFFVKLACSEWKFVSVYQIWSKLYNSRLKYGDKAIFKMAAVRHLEFSKLQFWSCDLYWHEILYFLSKFRINRSIQRRDIAKKNYFQYGVRLPSWICKISNFC